MKLILVYKDGTEQVKDDVVYVKGIKGRVSTKTERALVYIKPHQSKHTILRNFLGEVK